MIPEENLLQENISSSFGNVYAIPNTKIHSMKTVLPENLIYVAKHNTIWKAHLMKQQTFCFWDLSFKFSFGHVSVA